MVSAGSGRVAGVDCSPELKAETTTRMPSGRIVSADHQTIPAPPFSPGFLEVASRVPSGRVVASPYRSPHGVPHIGLHVDLHEGAALAVVDDDRRELAPGVRLLSHGEAVGQQGAEGGHQQRVVERGSLRPGVLRGGRRFPGVLRTGRRARGVLRVGRRLPGVLRGGRGGGGRRRCGRARGHARGSEGRGRRRGRTAVRDPRHIAGGTCSTGGERDPAADEGQGQHTARHGGGTAAAHGAPSALQCAVHHGASAGQFEGLSGTAEFRTEAVLERQIVFAGHGEPPLLVLDARQLTAPKGPVGRARGGQRAANSAMLPPSSSRSRPSARTQRVRTAAGLTWRAAAVSSMLRSSQYRSTTTARSLGASCASA